MEDIVNYLKFFGVILGIPLLLGFILKWLGLGHWFDLIGEVFLRAGALFLFFILGVAVYSLFKEDIDMEKDTEVWKTRTLHLILQCVLFFGAAAVMTFWEQIF